MISINVDYGDWQKKVSALTAVLDPETVLDEASAVLLNRIRTRFLAETDPDNKKWIPSAAGERRKAGGYTYRKGRRWTGTGTLFETGDLFHSIQLAAVGSGERSIKTDIYYAKRVQEGDAKQPARPFLGFNDEDADMVTRVIIKRIKEALK